MPEKPVNGSCLCKIVSYKITDTMGIFQYCHCSRCRKFTGSAFAANLFVAPEHFNWLQGEDFVGSYQPQDLKYFATAFCTQCGSSLPWLAQTGKVMVVPAGTLDDDPEIKPSQNIFCASDAGWYQEPHSLKKFDELPQKSKK